MTDFAVHLLVIGYSDMNFAGYGTRPAALGEIGTCLWPLAMGARPRHAWGCVFDRKGPYRHAPALDPHPVPGTRPPSWRPDAPPWMGLPVVSGNRTIGRDNVTLLDLSFIGIGNSRTGTAPFDGQRGACALGQHHAVIDLKAIPLRLDVPASAPCLVPPQ